MLFRSNIDSFIIENIFQEEMFTFKRTSLPVARSIHYQLIDIQLEEVQQMVHSNDGEVRKRN